MLRPAGLSDSDTDYEEPFGANGNFDGKSPSDCTDDATNTSHNDDDDKDSTAADDNPEILLATSDLIKAIATGDHKTFASLIGIVESNKKLNVWGLGLVTPAGLCCCHGQYNVLQLLLDIDKGAHCDGEGFMLLAAAGNNISDDSLAKCAKLLLNLDTENVNQTNNQGWTPLMMASRKGRKNLAHFLMDQGAHVNLTDNLGWSALMFSVDSGHGDIARLLLNSGANPDHINNNGQTSADIAATANRVVLQEVIESFSMEKGRSCSHVTRKDGNYDHLSEMEAVLKNATLGHLITAFHDHNIDLESFLVLRESDINVIVSGVIGDGKKLLSLQAEMHKAEWSKSSIPTFKAEYKRDGLLIDTVSSTCMMSNISHHCRFMKLNIGYVRSQLKDHGARMLQAGADVVLPSLLLTQVEGCIKHTATLSEELALLKNELKRHKIVQNKTKVNQMKKEFNGFKLMLLTACGSSLLLGSLFLCKTRL